MEALRFLGMWSSRFIDFAMAMPSFSIVFRIKIGCKTLLQRKIYIQCFREIATITLNRFPPTTVRSLRSYSSTTFFSSTFRKNWVKPTTIATWFRILVRTKKAVWCKFLDITKRITRIYVWYGPIVPMIFIRRCICSYDLRKLNCCMLSKMLKNVAIAMVKWRCCSAGAVSATILRSAWCLPTSPSLPQNRYNCAIMQVLTW